MKKNLLHKILLNIIPSVFAICCILPFVMIISASFTDEQILKEFGYKIFPKMFSLDAYKYVFMHPAQLIRSYCTSIAMVLIGTPMALVILSGIAYALSRKDFKYRRIISMYLFITMIFSGGLVPSYILISKFLHLKDTFLVLILPSMVGAYNIILLRTFMQSIPFALIESAKLDGASELKILWSIMIPLSKTGLATIGLFIVLMYWNDWFTSMLYIDNNSFVPLQYMLYKMLNNANFITQNSSGAGSALMGSMKIPNETVRMANCVLAAGPMLMVFPFFQKYFVKGITVGSVKG